MQLFSFFKKEFVKNVITLITGSALSQLILYVAILWLTRLFSTEAFGVYMLFSSAILILKPIISLQLELAVLLPKKNKNAINIFAFSILTIFILNVILSLVILIFKDGILLFFKIEKLAYFIYLLPFSCFFLGATITLNYWNNRIKSFKNIAQGNVVKASVLSSSQITTGLSKFNYLGLIPGLILGQIIQVIFLFTTAYKTLKKDKKHISFSRMFFLIKKYKDIPLYNTLINFLNTLSNEIPILLITRYFGLSFAGIYGLALKVGKAPAGVIESSISQVFINKATETYNNKGDLYHLLKRTFNQLLKIGVIIFIPILIFSFFIDIIFGENWVNVGTYLRILIPWIFVGFLTAPFTFLFTLFNKQKFILLCNSFLLLFRFLAFYVGYYVFNDILISIALFTMVGVIFNTFILRYFFKLSKNTDD